MSKIKTPFFILAIAVTVFILVSPPPAGLSQEGQAAIAVFAMCFILWTTGALPLSVTSLLAIAFLPLFGALEAGTAFSLFGNRAVFFILGAFMLAAAMMSSGLSVRISLLFLRRFEGSPKRLLSGDHTLLRVHGDVDARACRGGPDVPDRPGNRSCP